MGAAGKLQAEVCGEYCAEEFLDLKLADAKDEIARTKQALMDTGISDDAITIDYRNGGKRHVAYCSEYHKGKAKNPKCYSPHIMDADLPLQTVLDVLKKIAEYSISNRAEFEALVKKSLAMQQTDKTKKHQKRIPKITTRLEQIEKVPDKLYEDNALGTISQDRYEYMSQKYSEEYYTLKEEVREAEQIRNSVYSILRQEQREQAQRRTQDMGSNRQGGGIIQYLPHRPVFVFV